MMPIVNGLEDKFAGGINVVQLDAAEGDNAALQEQYGLRGHPSFEETLRTMFTLGNGDFYPVGGWELVNSLVVANGMVLVTLAISYLFAILPAVVQPWTPASQIHSPGQNAATAPGS